VRIHNESTGDAGASFSTMRNPLIDQQTTIDSPVRRMRTAQVLLLVLTGVFLALGFASHARTNLHLG